VSKQEAKRRGKLTLRVELHYCEIIRALRQAIAGGDPTRFSLDDARELEVLARDIRITVHSQDTVHEHSVETCEHCRESARHEEYLSRDPDQLIELVKNLRDDLVCFQEDVSWHEAVLNGSWPNARFILTRALNKCPEDSHATA
jgi:hypothetical protein